MQVAETQHASLFSRFSFASPKEKLQKKRGQAKMLPYTLAGARPLLPEAIPRLTLDKRLWIINAWLLEMPLYYSEIIYLSTKPGFQHLLLIT